MNQDLEPLFVIAECLRDVGFETAIVVSERKVLARDAQGKMREVCEAFIYPQLAGGIEARVTLGPEWSGTDSVVWIA